MEECEDQHTKRHKTKIGSVPFHKAWPIFGRVEERCHDASSVTQHDLSAGSCGAATVSWVVGIEPCYVEAKSDVDAGGNDAAAEVEYARWAVGQENAVSDDADCGAGGCNGSTNLLFIADPGEAQIYNGTDSIAWPTKGSAASETCRSLFTVLHC